MQQARVAFYQLKPDAADEVIRRAESELLLTYRGKVGFVAYGIMKTGHDRLITVSIWDLAEQAEEAVRIAAQWEQERIGHVVNSVENHVGDLAFFWALVDVGR